MAEEGQVQPPAAAAAGPWKDKSGNRFTVVGASGRYGRRRRPLPKMKSSLRSRRRAVAVRLSWLSSH